MTLQMEGVPFSQIPPAPTEGVFRSAGTQLSESTGASLFRAPSISSATGVFSLGSTAGSPSPGALSSRINALLGSASAACGVPSPFTGPAAAESGHQAANSTGSSVFNASKPGNGGNGGPFGEAGGLGSQCLFASGTSSKSAGTHSESASAGISTRISVGGSKTGVATSGTSGTSSQVFATPSTGLFSNTVYGSNQDNGPAPNTGAPQSAGRSTASVVKATAPGLALQSVASGGSLFANNTNQRREGELSRICPTLLGVNFTAEGPSGSKLTNGDMLGGIPANSTPAMSTFADTSGALIPGASLQMGSAKGAVSCGKGLFATVLASESSGAALVKARSSDDKSGSTGLFKGVAYSGGERGTLFGGSVSGRNGASEGLIEASAGSGLSSRLPGGLDQNRASGGVLAGAAGQNVFFTGSRSSLFGVPAEGTFTAATNNSDRDVEGAVVSDSKGPSRPHEGSFGPFRSRGASLGFESSTEAETRPAGGSTGSRSNIFGLTDGHSRLANRCGIGPTASSGSQEGSHFTGSANSFSSMEASPEDSSSTKGNTNKSSVIAAHGRGRLCVPEGRAVPPPLPAPSGPEGNPMLQADLDDGALILRVQVVQQLQQVLQEGISSTLSTAAAAGNDPSLGGPFVGHLCGCCSTEEMLDKQQVSTASDFERLDATVPGDPEARIVNVHLAFSSFRRSDAGKPFKQSDTRPAVWCRRAVHALLTYFADADLTNGPQQQQQQQRQVLPRKEYLYCRPRPYTYIDVYNFLRDRLRACWQELTVQHVSPHRASIETLEISFRFLVLSEELLAGTPGFDAVSNHGLMQTCLDKLMQGYEATRAFRSKRDATAAAAAVAAATATENEGTVAKDVKALMDLLVYSSPYEGEFWGFRLLMLLSQEASDTALVSLLQRLPQQLQQDPSVRFALEAYRAFRALDLRRYVRLMREGPYLLCVMLHKFLPYARARFLAVLVLSRLTGGSRNPISPQRLSLLLGFDGEDGDMFPAFLAAYGIRTAVSPRGNRVCLLEETDKSLLQDLSSYKKAKGPRAPSAYLMSPAYLSRQQLLDPDYPAAAFPGGRQQQEQQQLQRLSAAELSKAFYFKQLHTPVQQQAQRYQQEQQQGQFTRFRRLQQLKLRQQEHNQRKTTSEKERQPLLWRQRSSDGKLHANSSTITATGVLSFQIPAVQKLHGLLKPREQFQQQLPQVPQGQQPSQAQLQEPPEAHQRAQQEQQEQSVSSSAWPSCQARQSAPNFQAAVVVSEKGPLGHHGCHVATATPRDQFASAGVTAVATVQPDAPTGHATSSENAKVAITEPSGKPNIVGLPEASEATVREPVAAPAADVEAQQLVIAALQRSKEKIELDSGQHDSCPPHIEASPVCSPSVAGPPAVKLATSPKWPAQSPGAAPVANIGTAATKPETGPEGIVGLRRWRRRRRSSGEDGSQLYASIQLTSVSAFQGATATIESVGRKSCVCLAEAAAAAPAGGCRAEVPLLLVEMPSSSAPSASAVPGVQQSTAVQEQQRQPQHRRQQQDEQQHEQRRQLQQLQQGQQLQQQQREKDHPQERAEQELPKDGSGKDPKSFQGGSGGHKQAPEAKTRAAGIKQASAITLKQDANVNDRTERALYTLRSPEEELLLLLQQQTEWPGQPFAAMLATAVGAAIQSLPTDAIRVPVSAKPEMPQHPQQQQLWNLQSIVVPRIFFKAVFFGLGRYAVEAMLLRMVVSAAEGQDCSSKSVAAPVLIHGTVTSGRGRQPLHSKLLLWPQQMVLTTKAPLPLPLFCSLHAIGCTSEKLHCTVEAAGTPRAENAEATNSDGNAYELDIEEAVGGAAMLLLPLPFLVELVSAAAQATLAPATANTADVLCGACRGMCPPVVQICPSTSLSSATASAFRAAEQHWEAAAAAVAHAVELQQLTQQDGQKSDSVIISIVFALCLPRQFFFTPEPAEAPASTVARMSYEDMVSAHPCQQNLQQLQEDKSQQKPQHRQPRQLVVSVDDEVHTACATVLAKLCQAICSKFPQLNHVAANLRVRCIAVVPKTAQPRNTRSYNGSSNTCSSTQRSCSCIQKALPLTRGLLQCLALDPWEGLRQSKHLRTLLRQRPVLLPQQQILVSGWAHLLDKALAAAAAVAATRARQSLNNTRLGTGLQRKPTCQEWSGELISAEAEGAAARVAADADVCAEAFRAGAAAAASFLQSCNSSLWLLPPAEWLLDLHERLQSTEQQRIQQRKTARQAVAAAALAGCFPSADTDALYKLAEPLLQKPLQEEQQLRETIRLLRTAYSKETGLSQLINLASLAGATTFMQERQQEKGQSLEAVFAAAFQAARRNAAAAVAGSKHLVLPHSVCRIFSAPSLYFWGTPALPQGLAATTAVLQEKPHQQEPLQNNIQIELLKRAESVGKQRHQLQNQHPQLQRQNVRQRQSQPYMEESRRLRRRVCRQAFKLIDDCMQYAAEETRYIGTLLERLRS